jgi:hypothetical protein
VVIAATEVAASEAICVVFRAASAAVVRPMIALLVKPARSPASIFAAWTADSAPS